MPEGEELIRARAEWTLYAQKLRDYDAAMACKKVEEETLQQSILAETARRLEEARADLIEASRKRRTFEILRDSELLARKKARRKRETALLDEAAANLWLRGRGQ